MSHEKKIALIKNRNWIKKMGDIYLTIWEELAKEYAPCLDRGSIIKGVAYTQHDFSHHCNNIYKIIDNCFFEHVEIEEEERFLLAVAVLLHDIAMTKTSFNRLNHSVESADYIQREINKGVRAWDQIEVCQIEIIKDLIIAHSDIRKRGEDGKERIERHTLKDLAEVKQGSEKKIHVKWLAGVLRLADELDITTDRKGGADDRYKDLDEKDVQQAQSKDFWEQLNYFKEIKRDRTKLMLVLNDEYLRENLEKDRPNIVNRIKKIRIKIKKTFDEVVKETFDNSQDYYTKINIKEILLADEKNLFHKGDLDEDLGLNYLSKKEGRINLDYDEKREDLSEDDTNKEESFEDGPVRIRESLGEKISNYIYEKCLIHSGHYRLNRRICSRDWIDVRTVISDVILGSEIIEVIKNDLKLRLLNDRREEVLAIGIGVNGNILASRVAYSLGMPFTYLLPTKPGTIGTDMEKSIQLENYKKVVIFTAVISSFDTIINVVRKYLQNVEIIKVYTVLWRKILGEYVMNDEEDKCKADILRKLVYINDDFSCDIIPPSVCMKRKYNRCVAENRKAFDEVYQWPLAVKSSIESRVFINNVIGCQAGCKYCYLREIGIENREIFAADEVIAEFERLNEITKSVIISFGCYAECLFEENIKNMVKLIGYFAKKGFVMQLSTKARIKTEWLDALEKELVLKDQLHIFVSIPIVHKEDRMEPKSATVSERIKNFDYGNKSTKIRFYLYIKPFLDSCTIQGKDKYANIMTQYGVDTVVGKKFDFTRKTGKRVSVGIHDMFEADSQELESLIKYLNRYGNVYRNSIEAINQPGGGKMEKVQLPLKVFISYSHQDKALKERLMKHLNSLIRQKYIEIWHDSMVLPGADVNEDISRQIEECDMALLLISADYLASDYCYSVEMETFMKLRDVGKTVVPVLLRPVDLDGTPFENLKALPEDRKAVSSFSDEDEAMKSVASGIRMVIDRIYKKSIPGMKGVSQREKTMSDVSSSSTPVNHGFVFYGNEINGGSFEIKN